MLHLCDDRPSVTTYNPMVGTIGYDLNDILHMADTK